MENLLVLLDFIELFNNNIISFFFDASFIRHSFIRCIFLGFFMNELSLLHVCMTCFKHFCG